MPFDAPMEVLAFTLKWYNTGMCAGTHMDGKSPHYTYVHTK